MEKKKCLLCEKTIRTMGNKRKNGKIGLEDWGNRQCHKKCWIESKSMKMDYFRKKMQHYYD